MALIRTGSKFAPKSTKKISADFDITKVPFRTATDLGSKAVDDSDTLFGIAVALLSLTSDTNQVTTNWQLNALLHSHRGLSTK